MLPVDSSPPAEGADNQRKKTKMRLAFWPHYHSLLDTWGTPELRLPWGGHPARLSALNELKIWLLCCGG